MTLSDRVSVNISQNKELRVKIRFSMQSLRYILDTFNVTATKLEVRMKNKYFF